MTLFSCRHASRLISDALDRPLSWRERLALCFHLVICRPCRRFRQHLGRLRAALREPPPAAETPAAALTPEARTRIREVLEQRGNGPSGPT